MNATQHDIQALLTTQHAAKATVISFRTVYQNIVSMFALKKSVSESGHRLFYYRYLTAIAVVFFMLNHRAAYSQDEGTAVQPDLYSVEWARTIGGEYWDEATCVIETRDRGLVASGYALKKEQGEVLATDFMLVKDNKITWIVKVDAWGRRVWGRTYEEEDFYTEAKGIVETDDSCLVVAGICYPKNRYDSDLWIMKTDSRGNKLWTKTYQVPNNQGATDIVCTSDGGFALSGFTESNEDLTANAWIVRLDANGELLWEETFGGSKVDLANSIVQTPDNGFAAAGFTMSRGQGVRVMWVIKVSDFGMWEWDEVYNASFWDVAWDIAVTSDSALVVAGFTRGEGLANYDVRVIKIDRNGRYLWGQTFGGREWEEATAITETYEGGFAVSAYTKSRADFDNFWVLKLNPQGIKEWDKTFGGSNYDYCSAITETYDKGLMVMGSSYVSQAVGWDFAFLKLVRAGFTRNDMPELNFHSPMQYSTSTDSAVYPIDICIQSVEPIENVSIFVNDTVHLDSVPLIIPDVPDSTCHARIRYNLPLSAGENRVKVEIKNLAGTTTEEFRLHYLLLVRIRW